ncbi:MAG: hypothetical protein HQK49_05830 [Oligoflexia bacterium]|nr:hypothetical protein [Oligoflexia bacterium]
MTKLFTLKKLLALTMILSASIVLTFAGLWMIQKLKPTSQNKVVITDTDPDTVTNKVTDTDTDNTAIKKDDTNKEPLKKVKTLDQIKTVEQIIVSTEKETEKEKEKEKENSISTSGPVVNVTSGPQEKIITATFSAVANSNLYRFSSYQYSASADFVFNIEGKFPYDVIVGLESSFSKDLNKDREQKLNDSAFYIVKKLFSLGNYIRVSAKSSAIIPLSNESRNDKTLITSIGVGPAISFDLAMIGLRYVTFAYAPSFAKNFHRYTTDVNSQMNTSYSIKNKFVLSYRPWEVLELGSMLSLVDTWSYRYNRRIPNYENRYFINGTITEQLGVAMELIYGDALYKANGSDSNYKLLNEEKGTLSLGVTYTF